MFEQEVEKQAGSEQQENGQEKQQSSSQDVNGRGEQAVPYDRFKQVNDQVRTLKSQVDSYRSFGTPDELKEIVSRYQQLSKTNRFTEGERKQMRDEILELVPEFKAFQADREARTESFLTQAEARVPKYLGEVGLENNEQNLADTQELIAGRIARDPQMKRRYLAGDIGVVQEAWEDVKKRFFGGFQRKSLASVQKIKEGGPKSVQNGKAPTKEGQQFAEQTIQERLSQAGDAAWDRLQSQIGE